jgi:hypothetical protein
MDIMSAVGQFNYAAYGVVAMKWAMWGTLGLLIVLAFAVIYYYLLFTIKVEVIPLQGSTKDGVFVVGKSKSNKIRYTNNRSEWRSLWPIGNKITREPFDDKYINNKKFIRVFEIGDVWIPCEAAINTVGEAKNWLGQLNPVPHYIRNWQSLVHKKHNFEFAQHNFWEDNKVLIMTVVCVGLCLLLCAGTVWLTYKFTTPNTAAWGNFADALKNSGVVQAVKP